MKYNNHLNYKKRRRFILKVRLFLALFLVVLAAGGLMFYLKYVKSVDPNTPQSTTSQVTTSTVAASINIFKSPYFQFQASKSWVEVPNESNQNKFVYRSLKSSLIEHEIDIYVNQIPANLEANRVMPVTLTPDKSSLVPTTVSEHCVKANGGKSSIQPIGLTVSGVKMLCDSDSTNYTVFAGQKGGSTVLRLIRPNGTLESYTIFYTNLRAIPDASELTQILETFQTR